MKSCYVTICLEQSQLYRSVRIQAFKLDFFSVYNTHIMQTRKDVPYSDLSTSLSVTLLLLAYSPTFPSCPAILFTLMLLRTLCNELGLWVSSQPLTSGGSSYEDNEVCVVIGRRQLRQMAVVAMKQSSDNEESTGDWTKTAPPDGSCRYEAVIRRKIYW